jgi:ribosome biogenesis GTPase
MARDKGKSARRIKDWRLEDVPGSRTDRAASRQRLTRRAVKLPASRLAAPEDNLEELPKAEGMVVGFFPGGAIVRIDGKEMICGVAKTFRAPAGASALAVGDIATVALSQPLAGDLAGDKHRADGMILLRRPRTTVLARPQPRSGKRTDCYESGMDAKVIVANMDLLLIVASTRQPSLRQGIIDRFLIIAERGDLKPVVVINKIDLGPPDQDVTEVLAGLGVQVFACSAITGEGLATLAGALAGKRSVLAGASGVGKSTLVNSLVPGARAATRPIRMRDQRGRHTTASAAVYALPSSLGAEQGGIIVDTPAARELGVDLRASELPWYFPEFQEHAARCRFNDCSHTHEPNCAVQEAVESGLIPRRRFESYLRILDTVNK